VALRGLFSRKLRSVLTGFAVVIGVAFVVGTLVFTDTINASFTNIFERAQKGVDVSVEAAQPVKTSFSSPPTMPASALATVKSTPGVEAAEGEISGAGTLLDRAGKAITSSGAPTLLLSAGPEKRFQVVDYRQGGAPKTADEVAIDRATASKYGYRVGSRVTVQGDAPAKQYTVSGIVTLGDTDNLAGAKMLIFTLPEAQRVTGHRGYDSISVAAKDPTAVKAALQQRLGRHFNVLTGKEQAKQQAQDLSDALGFLRTALLIFAGVALLVGGFLIFNTFSVTVAQRTRELALLRVLGASRRQVLRSVLIETFIVGLGASIVGVLVGLVLAPALSAMLKAFGVDLGSTGLVIKPATLIVGLAIGVIATMISGFVPARRATRIEPVTAMRDSATPGVAPLRRRRLVGSIALGGLGLLGLLGGLFGGGSTAASGSLLGLGMLLAIFAVALVAPLLVRPLARVIGAPIAGLQGLTGVLARENAVRQPQRTAITASALMIGLALVVFVTIFAAGLKSSVTRAIDRQLSASLIVQSQDGITPIPNRVTTALRDVAGVQAASPVRFGSSRIEGVKGITAATGVDPRSITKVLHLKWKDGSQATLASMTDRSAIVDADWASSHHFKLGSTLQVTTPTGTRLPYRITGTFNSQAGLTSSVLVSEQSMQRSWGVQDTAFVIARGAPGTTPPQLQKAARAALRPYPSTDTLTIAQFKHKQEQSVNSLLGLVFALLALSIIVALLGIVNTLALSVHERTRELGMLRAVGMSRRQVRRMIRSESVITAVIGAVLGTVLGVVFAVLFSRPLASQGFVFVVPVSTLVLFFILAAVAGVLAAISPARRAAKVDVLRAVTAE